MMILLSRLYDTELVASHAVNELLANGLPEDDIGVIAPQGAGQ